MRLKLEKKFDTKDLETVSFALGISFKWYADRLMMSQTSYIDKIVKRFCLEEAAPA